MVVLLFDLFDLFGIYYMNIGFVDWFVNGLYICNIILILELILLKEIKMNLILI